MERQVIFRDNQEITTDDLNNTQAWAQASDDHIVADAITSGRAFVGFDVTVRSAVEIELSPGRGYSNGARFYCDDDDDLVVDLSSLRPNLQDRIVSIIGRPNTKETDVIQRDFEIDADNEVWQAQPVAMERRREVIIEAVGGAESASPVAPVIDNGAVVLAWIRMDTDGVVDGGVTRNVAGIVPNLARVAERVADLEDFEGEAGQQMSTLRSDLARIAVQAENAASKKLMYNIAGSVALLMAANDMPATYVGYRASRYLDETESDTAAAGYSARIEEGLRLPFAAEGSQALALLNPYNAAVRVSANGLMLPAYTEVERRITKGQAGAVSLASYAFENRSLTRMEMSRTRTRYGADFDVSMASDFWLSGTYVQRGSASVRGVFQRNGESFQVYETGAVDADGHKILRLSRYWVDTVDTNYWTRLATDDVILGYAHVETHLNAQDTWITALGPHMLSKPADGQLTVGICEVTDGEPNFGRVIAMVTLEAANVGLVSATGDFPKIPIEPTFLKAGQRYGYFVVTNGDFMMGVTDASQPATGAYFYGLNGGVWNANPAAHLIWRDWRASFSQSTIRVDLQQLNLAGGIQGVDILADAVAPESTGLIWSLQIGGIWRPLNETDPDILSSLPPQTPMSVTFVGTPDVMPGLRLPTSTAKFWRLALTGKHVGPLRTLPASTTSIVLTARLAGFGAGHTYTPTILRGGGAGVLETADTVETVTMPDGVVQKTATFNLAAAATQYRVVQDYATTSALNPFAIPTLIEVAE